MKTLRFEAPEAHVLIEDGKTYNGGDELTVTDDRALELLTQPGLSLSEVGAGKRTRQEWNELAERAGVPDPEALPSIGAVEAAIDGAQTQPVATGQGFDNDDKEA